MPIVSRWYDNEKTIILSIFSGTWTWDDLAEARVTIGRMINHLSADYVVDVITVFEDNIQVPTGALQRLRDVIMRKPDNTGVIFLVSNSPIVRMLHESFTVAYPNRKQHLQYTSTIEKAIELIYEIQQKRKDTSE